jgi:uncharacterized protein YqeY
MDTKERLQQQLLKAMRSNNEVEKRTIRMAIAGIKNIEIDKRAQLDDAGVISVLQKEIKMRNESIEGAEKAKRSDLVEEYREEIRIIEAFLPIQLTESEIHDYVMDAIKESNASTPADMGKVMKILIPKIQGRATNNQVNQIVRQILGG